jgi:hypothetical protein
MVHRYTFGHLSGDQRCEVVHMKRYPDKTHGPEQSAHHRYYPDDSAKDKQWEYMTIKDYLLLHIKREVARGNFFAVLIIRPCTTS